MKKIIAVFDGLRFSESTLQYTITLAERDGAHITGLFLDDFTYNSFDVYKMIREGATAEEIADFEMRDKIKRDKAGSHFESACQKAGLTCNVHHDKNVAIQDVLHESIYADLLVVGVHETFIQDKESLPTRFIRDLLAEVQCPVLVTPAEYTDIQKAVLLYDGEPSSVYAIKMAGYLLPWLKTMQVEVLSINEEETGNHLADNHLMREYMKWIFPDTIYKVMQGQPENKIVHHLHLQPANTLVVLGAYQRGMVSRWFRTSMADVLMEKLKLPLFIAHNK
ncbi:universal stress protein [Chitinophaga sp. SYP-B3965]|uniref:universal stress protein n=1 Tax=Chitinophaga sp. SYP-B3965 TaxID=2663120 RepID=UPI0012999BE0|nr:universal stress protein [Chitinophaga sp. SYP-B3965]MRG45333.1 universal stress protein [Chitinophaga sp. SYP-B3965]